MRRDADAIDQRQGRQKGGALAGSLVRHVRELQACARDQREALQQLRRTLAKLRVELERARTAVPATEAADSR